MCRRYARRSDKQKIAELFAIHGPVMPDFGPSWNVAPQPFAVAMKDGPAISELCVYRCRNFCDTAVIKCSIISRG